MVKISYYLGIKIDYDLAILTSCAKSSGDEIAISANTFLFNNIPAFLIPLMNLLYDKPFNLDAALSVKIHWLFLSRFFCFLPTYECTNALSTRSDACIYTFLFDNLKPFDFLKSLFFLLLVTIPPLIRIINSSKSHNNQKFKLLTFRL